MLEKPENAFGFEERNFKQVVFDIGKWLWKFWNSKERKQKGLSSHNLLRYDGLEAWQTSKLQTRSWRVLLSENFRVKIYINLLYLTRHTCPIYYCKDSRTSCKIRHYQDLSNTMLSNWYGSYRSYNQLFDTGFVFHL
jgi:hypothetical protein